MRVIGWHGLQSVRGRFTAENCHPVAKPRRPRRDEREVRYRFDFNHFISFAFVHVLMHKWGGSQPRRAVMIP